MIGQPLRYILLIVACMVSAAGLSAEERTPIGQVILFKGVATVRHADGTSEDAKMGSSIYKGDYLDVGRRSLVTVEFVDQSRIHLLGSSDLTINEYIFVEGKDGRLDVTIDNGALGFVAGKIKEIAPHGFTVNTAFATVGIRESGAGEVITSDGTLPGVERRLRVRKTAGRALTIQPRVPELTGVTDITTNGECLLCSPSGQADHKHMRRSLLTQYRQHNEQLYIRGRLRK